MILSSFVVPPAGPPLSAYFEDESLQAMFKSPTAFTPPWNMSFNHALPSSAHLRLDPGHELSIGSLGEDPQEVADPCETSPEAQPQKQEQGGHLSKGPQVADALVADGCARTSIDGKEWRQRTQNAPRTGKALPATAAPVRSPIAQAAEAAGGGGVGLRQPTARLHRKTQRELAASAEGVAALKLEPAQVAQEEAQVRAQQDPRLGDRHRRGH